MEGKTRNYTPKAKNVPKKFQEMFAKEPTNRNSPKPSTSKEPIVLNQERSSEMKMADSVSNSYLFAKDRPYRSVIASPLDSNSSFLYHYFDEDNNEVRTYDNPERQALGKLIKNYLEGDNEEDPLPTPPPHVFQPSPYSWTKRNPRYIQNQLPAHNSSLPLNTRILSPLQPGRIENENLPKLISPSLKPEIYNLDPFGNDSPERDHLRQSIRAASQRYDTALKTLENVINRLSEPWPGRKKMIPKNT